MSIPANPTTISDLIWYGFCVLLTGGILDTLRRLYNIEKKQDKIQTNCPACKEELKKEFVNKETMEEWKKGRDPLWNALNHHSHEGLAGEGRVIKK